MDRCCKQDEATVLFAQCLGTAQPLGGISGSGSQSTHGSMHVQPKGQGAAGCYAPIVGVTLLRHAGSHCPIMHKWTTARRAPSYFSTICARQGCSSTSSCSTRCAARMPRLPMDGTARISPATSGYVAQQPHFMCSKLAGWWGQTTPDECSVGCMGACPRPRTAHQNSCSLDPHLLRRTTKLSATNVHTTYGRQHLHLAVQEVITSPNQPTAHLAQPTQPTPRHQPTWAPCSSCPQTARTVHIRLQCQGKRAAFAAVAVAQQSSPRAIARHQQSP